MFSRFLHPRPVDRAETQVRPYISNPMAQGFFKRPHKGELVFGSQQLLGETRRSLSALLPFTDAERAFLDLLLEEGEIDATILTSDTSLQKRIQVQPLLEWKALNVRSHKELS